MLFWDEFPSKISRIYFSKRFRLKNKDVLGFFNKDQSCESLVQWLNRRFVIDQSQILFM